ncbi:MAG: SagB/ThcOx family dehydrogenase, partial [Sedimentisphaerales bacterium]|nr:SagB/ThcOx family dehydrogenase [Sedimentisphaerales bacterium]
LVWEQVGAVEVGEGEDVMVINFPEPMLESEMSVAEAIAARRSQRQFVDERLSVETVGQLCWAAQGITDERNGYRAAPSAGALYPITIYVVDRDGVYEYEPGEHRLRWVAGGDMRVELRAAAHNQMSVGTAPMCMVMAMDVDKMAARYADHAERYCLLEMGHIAQNVLLQATDLGLAGVPIGALDEDDVAEILDLREGLRPVYMLALGRPAR